MALRARRVTVTTTATELTGSDTNQKYEDRGYARSIVMTPAADIYIGGVGVTAATGYLVGAATSFALDLRRGEVVYGITASGSSVVSVAETGV